MSCPLMWAARESNPHGEAIAFGICYSHTFSFEHYPPSPPNAHRSKKLPNVVISFRDLYKLVKLTHPRANW
mgnify:FL=1